MSNPFDSFHDMVAEAKAEREQLDRLLTISTPRERLLVAAIGLLLAVLVGWLFLGSVPREVALQGALVEPSDFQPGGNHLVRAMVLTAPSITKGFKAGLPVKVFVSVPSGKREVLAGTLADIATARALDAGAESARLLPLPGIPIDIVLNDGLDFASLTRTECRIVIELGRQPPVALFGMRRS